MKTKKRINPAAAVPQAPRSLRVGATRARAAEPVPEPEPKSEPKADEDKDPDDDDDDDDEHDQEAHDAACTAAAEKMRGAADAYDAAKGSDSASALMAAEDAGDEAVEAHAAGKASCMKMRGAEADEAEGEPAAPPPAPGAARALAALAGPGATAQLELAQLAGFARDAMAKLGAKTLAGGAAKLDLAVAALAKMPKIAAAEKVSACVARLTAAVHAGMDRAKAFNIKPDGTLGAPLAAWARMSAAELDEVLTIQHGPAGTATGRSALIVAATEATDEAGLAARAAASGMDIETRRAAERNVTRSQQQEQAR